MYQVEKISRNEIKSMEILEEKDYKNKKFSDDFNLFDNFWQKNEENDKKKNFNFKEDDEKFKNNFYFPSEKGNIHKTFNRSIEKINEGSFSAEDNEVEKKVEIFNKVKEINQEGNEEKNKKKLNEKNSIDKILEVKIKEKLIKEKRIEEEKKKAQEKIEEEKEEKLKKAKHLPGVSRLDKF